MEITKLINELCEAVSIGHIRTASDIAKNELSKYAEIYDFGSIGVVGKIGSDINKPTLLLDAHIDEVGFIVTAIFDDGFVKVSNVGGIDSRILPSTKVTIHGISDIPAVFASTPPHLAKDESIAVSIDDLLLDTGLGNDAKNHISIGDYATFESPIKRLGNGRLSGKSFDDRISVAILIEVASRVYNKDIPYNLIFSFSEQEELGTRGAIMSGFANDCDESIALDVSFATAPSVSAEQSGLLGGGAMIGISPVLNKKITNNLLGIAKKHNIPFQKEVMGGKTGTDADVLSVSKCGIPSGLISIPLRNMHTPVEVIDLIDIESVCSILEKYILSGGNYNA